MGEDLERDRERERERKRKERGLLSHKGNRGDEEDERVGIVCLFVCLFVC